MRWYSIRDTTIHYRTKLTRTNTHIAVIVLFKGLKKDADSLRQELDIASLDPKEAHSR